MKTFEVTSVSIGVTATWYIEAVSQKEAMRKAHEALKRSSPSGRIMNIGRVVKPKKEKDSDD